MDLHQLMIEKLSGIITAEDDHLLEQLILKDEEVRKQWEDLKRSFPARDNLEYDLVESWEKISGNARLSRRRQWLLRISAAALLAGVIACAFFI
ncbi:hypothetical protein, partial [Chitinophaga sp.]|uniref:hypothetical protein n=1 Tax=Chitinophaga sp. TaxID=1869181 RepID=UPI0031DD9545